MSAQADAHSPEDVRELILVMPSDIDYVPVLEAVTGKVARDLNFDEDSVELIGVALIEGAMNAIKHGNKYDLTKRVYVTLRIDPVQLLITIKDEGEGFDPGAVANPFEGDNLFRDSGRGILMMNAYMDEVSHNEDGTELTIRKTRPGA
ncbi:ATP-binding protein [Candidatus Poribacteria bacterium]|nr:ATP-binding protein [Candidatus Poribacteria bacterium]MBT5710364.1 ATP-binding protein [Candidatus Poribacteria bacterium]MBT7097414.1 ATP-binding protein [Candidatus Poribacteria bacterium]MBT7803944.1 ATP-binding protein [Candidatus Poribacteria bacterium]